MENDITAQVKNLLHTMNTGLESYRFWCRRSDKYEGIPSKAGDMIRASAEKNKMHALNAAKELILLNEFTGDATLAIWELTTTVK